MDTYAANLSTASERLIQDFVKNLDWAAELTYLIQQVPHQHDFDPIEVDHDMQDVW